ncbi:MAG TPA: hypothetical protein VLF61_04270 [Rhabdochlamydiaceae bacterium]|nr:hypothetical protein [Rhabdochlamydiaceae bacterium]
MVKQYVKARKKNFKPVLWVPILMQLDPNRCDTIDASKDAPSQVEGIVFRTWKTYINQMTAAIGDPLRGSFEQQLITLHNNLDSILCACCVSYKTLHWIPKFWSLKEKGWPKNFMLTFFNHYKGQKKRAYLILYFLKNRKDCTDFFQTCETRFQRDFSETVFENPIFGLFFFGLATGMTINALANAGLCFNYIHDFLPYSASRGFPFLYYYLFQKKELLEISNGKPGKDDWLAQKLPFVPMTEEIYLRELEVLCQCCNVNEIYQHQTALDFAMKNGLKKEEEILKKHKASQYISYYTEIVLSRDFIKRDQGDEPALEEEQKEKQIEAFTIIPEYAD